MNTFLARPQSGQIEICRNGLSLELDFIRGTDVVGSFLDSTWSVANVTDQTKLFKVSVGNQVAGATLTLDAGAQTASRTLSVPVLAGADTLMVLGVAQTRTAALAISGNASALTAGPTGTQLQLCSVDGAVTSLVVDSYGVTGSPRIDMRWALGTAAVPALPQVGGAVFQLNGWGWDSGFQQQARMLCLAAETWVAGTARGTCWTWRVTAAGTTTIAEAMRLSDTGNLLIGTSTNPTGAYGLRITGTTAASSSITGTAVFGDGVTAATNVSVGAGKVYAGDSILSIGPTAGIGYTTGAGGTVTQATNRTTGVTLNKICGAITLFSAAGSASYQSFTVTNSAVAATDTIIVNQKSGTDKHIILVTNVSAGSFQVTFATTGGTTIEQPVFNFSVIKAVTA